MFNQLRQQLQHLRDEVNSITQIAAQLQQAEQSNSSQLQQLHQKELFAAQNLQHILSVASRLQQDISHLNNMTQQLSGMPSFPQTQSAFQHTASPAGQYAPLNYQTGFGGQISQSGYATAPIAGFGQRNYSTQFGSSPYQFTVAEQLSPSQQFSSHNTSQMYMPSQQFTTSLHSTPGQIYPSTQYGVMRQFGQAGAGQHYITTPATTSEQFGPYQGSQAQYGTMESGNNSHIQGFSRGVQYGGQFTR